VSRGCAMVVPSESGDVLLIMCAETEGQLPGLLDLR